MWNYVVTAQKPTAVTHAIVGNFTGPKDMNLIISKKTRIEIYLATPEGLEIMLDVPIYGRIAVMELYRPEGKSQDLLFVSTERYKFCVLSFDSATGQIITQANGDLQDRVARPTDIGQIGWVDPDCRLIGLHLYDGLLKVIPMQGGQLQQAFNIHLDEMQIIDMKCLYGTTEPTIAILSQDPKDERHVKTYEIRVADKELQPGPWELPHVESAASLLIPLKEGGLLIVGEQTIMFHDGTVTKSIAMEAKILKAWGKLDDTRYLLGDQRGLLYTLLLHRQSGEVTDLSLEVLGEASTASTLCYLDKSLVYLGSCFGDSQLIQLLTEPNENGGYLRVLETFTNVGPIVDLAVVDLEHQGQGQVITCSGAFKDGSLRIVRNGVGLDEQATIDLPGIKGIWSLRPNHSSEFDQFIILTFVGETRVLSMTGDELEETEMEGLQADQQTLYCGNFGTQYFLQVTPKGATLVDSSTFQAVSEWSPENGVKVNLASCTAHQILLSTGGGGLFYLELEGSKLTLKSQVKLENEISCLSINPIGNETENSSGSPVSQVGAVGMWNVSVRLVQLPSLQQILQEPLGGEILPRSVMLTSFEGIPYLLVTLGDGYLISFVLDAPHLRDRRKVSLGTQPVQLCSFRSHGNSHIFAASDRSTVIYSSNKKLLFSNVNLKDVTYVAPFHSESYPDSLAIATEDSLKIGAIDNIQKLHIRDVPLGEMPRRIAYSDPSSSLLLLSTRFDVEGEERSFVRLLNIQTFETVDTYSLGGGETGCSVTTCTFGEDPTEYFAVGTAVSLQEETEPSKGRILIFDVSQGRLKVVAQQTIDGAAYALINFSGKLLAGINSQLQLFSCHETEGGKELRKECAHRGHILALFLASHGDFIIVGDLMKSISLLLYKPQDNEIEEISRDYNTNWMTAVEVLGEDVFLGAENFFNLFTVQRNADVATDEERSKLETVGCFHLGEFVNRFRPGSLVMRTNETEPAIPTMIYGTVNGAIGVVASLGKEDYTFFLQVQEALTKIVNGIGGLSHKEWRSFSNERKTVEAKNFLDGDLIESFLDFRSEEMLKVAQALKMSVEDLSKRIETLQRAIH